MITPRLPGVIFPLVDENPHPLQQVFAIRDGRIVRFREFANTMAADAAYKRT